MNKIKYIGYYDILDNAHENRNFALSAANKMTYICSAINHLGYDVEIVSPSATMNRKGCPGKKCKISSQTELVLFRSMGRRTKIERVIQYYMMQARMFAYLLRNTKKGEQIIVYHSVSYSMLLFMLKKLLGFRLILEVEEIYSDVTGKTRDRLKEERIIRHADAYILSTKNLNEKINTSGKPYVVINGTYAIETSRDITENDDKIHCVYAGTFDPRKGVITAIRASEYLDERFHIHIIGFGSDRDKKIVEEEIEKLSTRTRCILSFDGQKSGEDYIKFIQYCIIGLSPQNQNASFNDTSFPSKVLSYLANGLHVVSIRIKSLECSDINDLLNYYDDDTPQSLASAIYSVDLSKPYDSRERVRLLDVNFRQDMKRILDQTVSENKSIRIQMQ